MNCSDIKYALQNRLGHKAHLMGCFTSDYLKKLHLPNIRQKISLFVINTVTQENIHKMGHWILLVVEKSPTSNIIYFDSLNIAPEVHSEDFGTFFQNNKQFSLYKNPYQLQPFDSLLCGFYIMFWMHKISHFGVFHTLNEMNEIFSRNNLTNNDHFVLMYYLTYLNSRPCHYIWQHTKPNLSREICKLLKLLK